MTQTRIVTPDSFAAYLARVLIAKKGFHPGTLPEARELLEHCDAVLTRANGINLDIVCIVDRERGKSEGFDLAADALRSIGNACLRYTGKTIFGKKPASISVVETRNGPFTPEETVRLEKLKSLSARSDVRIAAWALNVDDGEVWTNSSSWFGVLRPSFLENLMQRPRLPEAELTPVAPAAMAGRRPLVLTYALLGALVAIFAAECAFRIGSLNGLLDPSIETLVAFGALDRQLVVENGEWWRLFSAPLLHGGLMHIAFNSLGLFFAGAVLENVIGRAWFGAVFAVSAVTGAFGSLWFNPPGMISVGASGAIMGLFAAAFAVSYRYGKATPMRTFLQSGSLRVLIPSLIPLFDGLFGQRIDFAAHAGGAAGGLAVGGLLVVLWRKDFSLPPLRWFAWALGIAGVCGALFAAAQVSKGYENYALRSSLAPDEAIPNETSQAMLQSANLVADYPRDPRAHVYRAMALAKEGDRAGAENEWRAAAAEKAILSFYFKRALQNYIEANLALILAINGKKAEAEQIARPLCEAGGEFKASLEDAGLCR
jgi:rhomboid protease GluP